MIFHESYWEAAKNLPEETRHAFFDAVFAYAFDGVEPDCASNPVVYSLFVLARPNIDASRDRAERGRAGGKATGECKARVGNQNASKTQATCTSACEQNAREKEVEVEKEVEIKNEVEVETTSPSSKSPRLPSTSTSFSEEFLSRKKPPNAASDVPTAPLCQFDQLDEGDFYDARAPVLRIAATLTGDCSAWARHAWEKQRKRIGESAFRELCSTFWHELRAGEVPDNRGAAFTARLREWPSLPSTVNGVPSNAVNARAPA